MPIPMHRTQTNRRTAFALAAAVLIPSAWAQNASPVVPARVTVDAQPLEKVWLLPQREAPADVVARNESKLSAEVSGSVLRWNADVGDSVKKGELLVQIDPRDYELAVQRARASLEAARSRQQQAQAPQQRGAAAQQPQRRGHVGHPGVFQRRPRRGMGGQQRGRRRKLGR
ncbi:MAG: biotin/lipoyl-binding protein, partial [Hydrogenophaga sp.]